MDRSHPQLECRLAAAPEEVLAAQRLRYRVFVEELGGAGPGVDHARRLEATPYDGLCEHLLLLDPARGRTTTEQVVGVYRLADSQRLPPGARFYSEGEYDISCLRRSGRRLLELSRSCLDAQYRGGLGMMCLWKTLAALVEERGIGLLFGVASFHGTDAQALAEPLSQLHHAHLAPPELRPVSLAPVAMDLLPPERVDRARAMRAVPALIKAYLRLGGFVGEGAFVDHAFNTTDVCLVLDVTRLSPRQRAIYAATPASATPGGAGARA